MVGRAAAHLDDQVMHVEACAAAADQQSDVALKFDILRLAPGQGPPLPLVGCRLCLTRHDRVPLRMAEQGLLVDRHHRAHDLKPTRLCDGQGVDFQQHRIGRHEGLVEARGHGAERTQDCAVQTAGAPKLHSAPRRKAVQRVDDLAPHGVRIGGEQRLDLDAALAGGDHL